MTKRTINMRGFKRKRTINMRGFKPKRKMLGARLADIDWFITEGGPEFVGEKKAGGKGQKDFTGSGYGWDFMRERKAAGDNQEQAIAAILNDKGPAGEWARRSDDRQLAKAWQRCNAKGPEWPKEIGEAAYHGLTGEVVRMILPQAEAGAENLLITFLLMVGHAIGRSAYFIINRTWHHANEYLVFAGPTSTGRKGTGYDCIRDLFKEAEKLSTHNDIWLNTKSGLSSGEGLITPFVDPEPIDDKPTPSPPDKRGLIYEPEFSRVLIVMNRPDNILSLNLINGWDHGNLSTMTRRDPLEAKDVHLSIVSHITPEELRRRLTHAEWANGFANRFLFAVTKASKLDPFGTPVEYDKNVLRKLDKALQHGSKARYVGYDQAFKRAWPKLYANLNRERPGLAGALLSARAAPHVRRLAMIYALLDHDEEVGVEHLNAALEVWRYCEDSVRFIFGDVVGDLTADAILRELRRRGTEMTRFEISNIFTRNRSRSELEEALKLLEQAGYITRTTAGSTGGRPKEIWKLSSGT